MERLTFKKELFRHKNQMVDASIKFLQQGFTGHQKGNCEFLEENYYNLEERLTVLERKVKEPSRLTSVSFLFLGVFSNPSVIL